MKSIVTGAEGFIGGYLIKELLKRGDDVIATYHKRTETLKEIENKAELYFCDFKSEEDIYKLAELAKEKKADRIFHLAAKSFPTFSLKYPAETFKVNILGTLHLFEALRKAEINPVVLVACSSAQYGAVLDKNPRIKEISEQLPEHPYGISKVSQDLLARFYNKSYGLRTIRARIFNTVGPGKQGEVISDFAKQIVWIERKEQSPEMRVGNLNAKRDFTDVRDNIKALILLTEKGTYGDEYNICSSEVHEIKEILDYFLANSDIGNINVIQDKSLFRPVDEPEISGSYEKLKKTVGWNPKISFEQTLKDVLKYWRQKQILS